MMQYVAANKSGDDLYYLDSEWIYLLVKRR
jgi:hypothetical protein